MILNRVIDFFRDLSRGNFPFLLFIISILFLFFGLYFCFFISPADEAQGSLVKIMYIHVPCAWLSLLCYMSMTIASFCYIVWRNPIVNVMAQAAAPIGMCLTLVCIITGSIWGKPTWGTWWAWDIRLIFMVIILFFYASYVSLMFMEECRRNIPDLLAILNIAGAINIPIVKLSVVKWNTIHQPPSISVYSGKVAITHQFMQPLFIMLTAMIIMSFSVWLIRINLIVNRTKCRRMEAAIANE